MSDDNIVNLEQERVDRNPPTLEELICSFTAHNCDSNRPYTEQQPKRAQIEIKGLTRRDIKDCFAIGILTCREDHKYPMVYVSEAGTEFHNFDDLVKSDEGYGYSYIDPTKVTYNDLFGWDLNSIDPAAALQNAMVEVERRMGIYPAVID